MVTERFSTARTAQILDTSTSTLNRWYKWYENDDFVKPAELILPKYTTDNRGTKFFTMDDIAVLEQFKNDLQGKYRGIMAEFNAYWQWGQYGTQRLSRKREKEHNEQNGN